MRRVPGPTGHVVVVGAGLSGLACALHLLGAGRRVTVVERDAGPGGRSGRVRLGGYELDTGPTVLTMPHLADEAFAAVGDSLRRRVELTALDPAYRACFADGSALDVHTDGEAMEAEVRRFAGPAQAAGYRDLRRWLERLYRAQMRRFIDTNFDSPSNCCTRTWPGWRHWGIRTAGRPHRTLPVRRAAAPRLLLPGAVRRCGPGPRPRRLRGDRVHGHRGRRLVPQGRHARAPRAMADAAATAGADLRWSAEVKALERSAGRVRAVHLASGERIACDAVVLTCELSTAYGLLGRAPGGRPGCGTLRPP